MTICKFYMQGNCRYGSSCKFEHPRGQLNYQDQSRDYRYQSYQSRSHTQTQFPRQETQYAPSRDAQKEENLTGNEFLDHVRKDMSDWINSSAWKLSCYSYSRTAPCIPVLQDFSPEEVRFSFYEAKTKNNLPQAINEYNNKMNENLNIIKQMINPNQQTKEYLLKYFYESEKLNKNVPSLDEKKSDNPFMKIVQQKEMQKAQTQPMAMQTSHIPTPTFGTGFGSIFTKAAEPAPQINLAPRQEAFQIPASKPVETNFFSKIVQMSAPSNVSNQNTFFGQKLPLIKEQIPENNAFYSQMNEIGQQDINEFKMNEFTIGRIPSIPPAKEFC